MVYDETYNFAQIGCDCCQFVNTPAVVDAALLPDPSEINNKPKTDPWMFVTLHGMSKKNNGISLEL